MRDEVPRAEESVFLQVEADEHDASLGPFFSLNETARDFKQHRHARGVVVRAGVKNQAALAEVVVMRGDDDPLVLQLRVGAFELRADIAAGVFAGDALREFAVEKRFELEFVKMTFDVSGGFARPALRRPAYSGEARVST